MKFTREDFIDVNTHPKNKESIANIILRSILALKRCEKPVYAKQKIELYSIDKDYDIELVIQLAHKKSQYQIGLEMLGCIEEIK